MIEALSICEKFEQHVGTLKSGGYDLALREMAADPKISLAGLVEVVEKTLCCPLHERGIETYDILASRVQRAAEAGNWKLWPIHVRTIRDVTGIAKFRRQFAFVPVFGCFIRDTTCVGEASQAFTPLQFYRPRHPVAGDFRQLFAEVEEWCGKAGKRNG